MPFRAKNGSGLRSHGQCVEGRDVRAFRMSAGLANVFLPERFRGEAARSVNCHAIGFGSRRIERDAAIKDGHGCRLKRSRRLPLSG